ncbi:MAG: cation:proton antiporter [Planctomycetia bacterium]|nr:cation:proton antiporter [Planctomycetia bacterium]
MFAVVLIQLVVIIAVARLTGWIFRQFHQPMVVGEIVGGILLGPSLFQPLAPELWATIFRPEVQPAFQIIKELGLVLLLFIVGMEFDFSHLRHLGRAAVMISIVGIALPFIFGLGLAPLLHSQMEMQRPLWGLCLFMGTALSITALPVLGRMMMELGITKTKLGTVTITAAAVDDAAAWILLASIVAAVRSQFDPAQTLLMILQTMGFVAIMLLVIRPLMRKLLDFYFARTENRLELLGLSALLILLMLCGWITLKIGVFAEFGAFMFGASLSGNEKLHHALGDSFRNFVSAFFLPVFFTYTGLNTAIGSLQSVNHWLLAILIMVAAVVGKFVGCTVVAHWNGYNWKEASLIGAMMNTRALMALIVLNVGLEQGILNKTIFTMLVLMAIVTTLMTTPLLKYLYRGTELEEPINQSGLFRSAWRKTMQRRR